MDQVQDFPALMEELGRSFAGRCDDHDAKDTFVSENFAILKERKVFSAMVPRDLGGGGISHRALCQGLRNLARHCSSTALSLSMHQHLIAAQTFNHLHGKPGRKILEMVANRQLVLVSTGANDWLASNGSTEKVEGGYRVTARKSFASGSPAGDILMTSAAYLDPKEGWLVLHFPVPFSAEGLKVLPDWQAMGMRGTGSNSVSLENVFIPEEAIAFRRPRGILHPAFYVIATVACPLIMSVYVGIAEAAAQIARDGARRRSDDAILPYLLGEMENDLATGRMALDSLMDLANDLDFVPGLEATNAVLVRKTIAAKAALATGEKALECLGGSGFYRASHVERLLRDLHAGQFHPLPEKRQHLLTGRLALGLEPVEPGTYPAPGPLPVESVAGIRS